MEVGDLKGKIHEEMAVNRGTRNRWKPEVTVEKKNGQIRALPEEN